MTTDYDRFIHDKSDGFLQQFFSNFLQQGANPFFFLKKKEFSLDFFDFFWAILIKCNIIPHIQFYIRNVWLSHSYITYTSVLPYIDISYRVQILISHSKFQFQIRQWYCRNMSQYYLLQCTNHQRPIISGMTYIASPQHPTLSYHIYVPFEFPLQYSIVYYIIHHLFTLHYVISKSRIGTQLRYHFILSTHTVILFLFHLQHCSYCKYILFHNQPLSASQLHIRWLKTAKNKKQ